LEPEVLDRPGDPVGLLVELAVADRGSLEADDLALGLLAGAAREDAADRAFPGIDARLLRRSAGLW
jgi:hypothetical protein